MSPNSRNTYKATYFETGFHLIVIYTTGPKLKC